MRHSGENVKRILAFLTAVAGMLFWASTAFANSLGCGHGATCQPGQGAGPGQAAGPGQTGLHTSGAGTLPFTGLNLVLIAGVALLLLVCGILLHRTARSQQ
jgi:hypothetical protein